MQSKSTPTDFHLLEKLHHEMTLNSHYKLFQIFYLAWATSCRKMSAGDKFLFLSLIK